MYKYKKPLALSFFNIRRMPICPPHFYKKNVPVQINTIDKLASWINTNITGRYFIGRSTFIPDRDYMNITITVGFESQNDLTLFLLSCPLLTNIK